MPPLPMPDPSVPAAPPGPSAVAPGAGAPPTPQPGDITILLKPQDLQMLQGISSFIDNLLKEAMSASGAAQQGAAPAPDGDLSGLGDELDGMRQQ